MRLPEDLMATPTGTLRLSEGSSAEGKTGIGRYSRQSDLARTLLSNGVQGAGLVNTVACSEQEQIPQGRDQFYWDSSVDNPDASPISDNVVELLLLERDRIQIIREIQLLEKRTIIARVLGIRPSRGDLRLLLQAALKQDVDNIGDVQMLGQKYYQLEFEFERIVPLLLERKVVAVKEGWVSFHKWIHNFRQTRYTITLTLFIHVWWFSRTCAKNGYLMLL